jgi:diadenylate cyclase
MINADFSGELLLSLFYGNNPLHDGAVIIKGDKIIAASCLLPLTQSKLRDRSLGTRHRAALGLSEHTDAIIIVTSEETGIISLARGGTLYRKLNRKRLLEHLLDYLQLDADPDAQKPTSESLFKSVSSVFKNAIND